MWTSLTMSPRPSSVAGTTPEPSILFQMDLEDSKSINFHDPNLNISYPVFSIHGNHDDPIGRDMLCPLDVLQASGLVNYFGKQRSLEHIDIYPILLRKGETTVALYGLGAVRDERLQKLFQANRVTFYQPDDMSTDLFNMFVLHQNRVPRAGTSYISQSYIPTFLTWSSGDTSTTRTPSRSTSRTTATSSCCSPARRWPRRSRRRNRAPSSSACSPSTRSSSSSSPSSCAPRASSSSGTCSSAPPTSVPAS